MRLSLPGERGHLVTFERHHRVGSPGETAATVKVNAGPVVRLTAEQETQLRRFLEVDPTQVTRGRFQ